MHAKRRKILSKNYFPWGAQESFLIFHTFFWFMREVQFSIINIGGTFTYLRTYIHYRYIVYLYIFATYQFKFMILE